LYFTVEERKVALRFVNVCRSDGYSRTRHTIALSWEYEEFECHFGRRSRVMVVIGLCFVTKCSLILQTTCPMTKQVATWQSIKLDWTTAACTGVLLDFMIHIGSTFELWASFSIT